MKVVLQRVTEASVEVEGNIIGEIGRGYVVFLGVGCGDTKEIAEKMADKIKKLRLFPDENGKTNLSIDDIGGEVLVISQFTLYADARKGTRPSFVEAGPPDLAEELYEYFISLCEERFKKTAHGSFGASMKVSLCNDGPFTICLELD